MSSRRTSSILLLCALLGCGVARAQPASETAQRAPATAEPKARAAALDRAARAAFARGDFEQAAEQFAAANATLPHPATRYNEAVARQRAGQLARAANLFEAVVEELPDADERRSDAVARLRELSAQLGRLSLSTSEAASASIAFVRDRATPWQLYFEPGKYTLRVRFAGGSRERVVDLQAGQRMTLEVAAPPRAGGAREADSNTVAPPSQRRTWGMIALGGGAAAGVASGVLGYSTLRARDDFESSGNTDASLRERAVTLRALTNVAFGVCAVASGIGVYLLLSRPERTTAARIALQVGPAAAELRADF
jgi:tetratricopeptide (TPR) repeat protein